MIVRASVVLACLALSGGLVACGGDDSEDEAATPPPTTATATQEEPPQTQTEDEPAAGGETTEPGTELDLGATANVTLKPLNAAFDTKERFEVAATVLEITKGSLDDFKNVDLDEEQKKSTPYYVKVTVENTGDKALPKDEDPDVRFDAIDDRGQEQSNVIFFGDFERCDNPTLEKDLGAGDTHESCLVYLVPGGGSITEVRWTGSDEYLEKPVVWK